MGRKKFISAVLTAVLLFSGSVFAEDSPRLIPERSDLWHSHTNSYERTGVVIKDAGPYSNKIDKLWEMQFAQGVDGRKVDSSVLVDGERSYVFSWDDQASKADQNKIYCIETRTKTKIWELVTDPPKNTEFYTGYHEFYVQGINATPILYRNSLLFASVQGMFYNVNPQDGKVRWSKKLVIKDLLGIERDYAVQCSPVASCNYVYFGISYIGQNKIWTRDRCGKLVQILVPTLNFEVVKLDMDTGEMLESLMCYETEPKGLAKPYQLQNIRTNLAMCNGLIYAYMVGTMVCVDMVNSPATIIWSRKIESWYPYTCSPSVGNGKVFMGFADREFYCFNADENEVYWYSDPKLGIRCLTTPIIYKDKIIFGSSDSNVYCLNQSDGKIAWKFKTTGEILSTPLIAEGLLYIGGYGSRFYILNPDTGKLIDQYEVDKGGLVKSTFSFADGRLFFGTELGKVFCYGEVPEKISVSGPDKMKVDEVCLFGAKALDKKGKDYKCHLKWSLHPPELAALDNEFKLKALKPGRLTITVSCNGKKSQKVVEIKTK